MLSESYLGEREDIKDPSTKVKPKKHQDTGNHQIKRHVLSAFVSIKLEISFSPPTCRFSTYNFFIFLLRALPSAFFFFRVCPRHERPLVGQRVFLKASSLILCADAPTGSFAVLLIKSWHNLWVKRLSSARLDY